MAQTLVGTTGGFGHDLTSGIKGTGAETPLTPEQERAQARFEGATRSTIDTLLGLQGEGLREQGEVTRTRGEAAAAGITAAGYDHETQAYENAALTSEESAHLSKVSADLLAYQDMRKYQSTVGSQAAVVAGSGFKQAGSALYLAKSSFQQAQLTRQLDYLNGTEKSIGYLEQASASRAQGSAAGTARDAALALQATNTEVAGSQQQIVDQTNQRVSDLSTAMQGYFHTVDPTSVTPEARLSLSLIGDNPDQALSTTANSLTRESTQPENQIASPIGAPQDTLVTGGWGRNLAWGLH